MSSTHVISHALRAALLVVAGSALIGGPFLLGLDAAPLVTGVLVGTLAIALGLAGTEPGGRGSLPMSAQAVYDRGLALGLILAAGIFARGGPARGHGPVRSRRRGRARDDLDHALQRASNLRLPPTTPYASLLPQKRLRSPGGAVSTSGDAPRRRAPPRRCGTRPPARSCRRGRAPRRSPTRRSRCRCRGRAAVALQGATTQSPQSMKSSKWIAWPKRSVHGSARWATKARSSARPL